MKLPRADSEKEAYALDLFKKMPESTSAAAINKKVAEQFGSPLRGNRLYQLKRQALGKPLTSARRRGKSAMAQVNEAVPQVVHFKEDETPLEFLARSLEQMRQAGILNLTVQSANDRYVVIDYPPE